MTSDTKPATKPPKKPAYWGKACQQLAATDSTMARLIAQYPGISMRSRGDPFSTLARSIVGQQISVKAADSVWQRVCAIAPAFTPDALLAKTSDELRACGLSTRKVEYLSDLAHHFHEQRLHPSRWRKMSDAAIIAELTAIRGIGVWTAEMFLMFHELRPDIFPLDDIGLQKAVARHYLADQRPTRKDLIALGAQWQPWRSVATWYLWRSLDPVPVEY